MRVHSKINFEHNAGMTEYPESWQTSIGINAKNETTGYGNSLIKELPKYGLPAGQSGRKVELSTKESFCICVT